MKMKKIAALALAAVLTLGMSITASAKSVDTGLGGESIIEITNASYGKTYEVYKVFEATLGDGGAIAYTSDAPISKELGLSFYTNDVMNADGKYSVLQTEQATEQATAEDIAWIKSNGSKVTAAVADDGTGKLTFNELEPGYYYITTSNGSFVTINSAAAEKVEVADKNSTKPEVPENPKTVEAQDTTIGQTATYTLTFIGTNYKIVTNDNNTESTTTKIEYYDVVDTSTQLAVDTETIKVTIDEEPISFTSNYNEETGELSIRIPWVDDNGVHLYETGSAVVITYDAEILAVDAENKATFSNNIEGFGNGEAKVDNFDFTLTKVADDESTQLEGAKFTLKKGDDVIELVATNDGYRVANSKDANKVTDIEAGSVKVEGLGAGTYSLTETVAPEGYNLLESPMTIVIDAEGNVTYDGTPGNQFSVVNHAGSLLPSTGGIGTTIFYVVGGILVAAAVVLLVTKKRMSNRA